MRRRSRKPLGITGIIIIFVVCTLTMSVGYSLLSEQLSVEATSNMDINNYYVDEEEKLKLDYTYNKWYSGGQYYYQYDFTLTNISNEIINNWKIAFDVNSDTELLQNWSSDVEIINSQMIIKSVDYNSTLSPGASITFGLQIFTSDDNYQIAEIKTIMEKEITNNETNTTENEKSNDDNNEHEKPSEEKQKYDVTFDRQSYWSSDGEYYIQYNADIKNNTDTDIDNWNFSFQIPSDSIITNYWNFNYVNKDGLIIVTPASYNKTLSANSTIQIGFQIKSSSLNFTLKQK